MFSALRSTFRTPYLLLPRLSGASATFARLPVAGRIVLAASRDQTGFAFAPVNPEDFPRRVAEGERIAGDPDGFPLLAPLPGILDYDPSMAVFTLKTEGSVRFGRSGNAEATGGLAASLRDIPDAAELRGEFLRRLLQAGVPSLDFRGLSLATLLDRVLSSADATVRPCVVFDLSDPEGGIEYERLPEFSRDRLQTAQDLLRRMSASPELDLVILAGNRSGPRERARNLAEVRAARACGRRLDHSRPLEGQGVAYLGPATLYALFEFLFSGPSGEALPFVSRPLAVVRESGATQIYPLVNGYDLETYFQEQGASVHHVIAGDFFREPARNAADPALRYFNIFRRATLYLLRSDPGSRQALNLPCTGCLACEQICPVDARPLALIQAGRREEFRADRCLQCGLCTYVCEAGIDLSHAIEERRGELNLRSRPVW